MVSGRVSSDKVRFGRLAFVTSQLMQCSVDCWRRRHHTPTTLSRLRRGECPCISTSSPRSDRQEHGKSRRLAGCHPCHPRTHSYGPCNSRPAHKRLLQTYCTSDLIDTPLGRWMHVCQPLSTWLRRMRRPEERFRRCNLQVRDSDLGPRVHPRAAPGRV